MRQLKYASKLTQASLIATCLIATPALAVPIFASQTFTLLRGSVAGSFPGQYYGGDLATFPVVLTDAQARASVLGANDNIYLTLPGEPQVSGTGFTGAYIEVGFGANFNSNNNLMIWEVGNNAEQAHIFLWSDNGGNVQFVVTTNAAGLMTIDLSVYASSLTALGGTSWTKVGIGGLDTLGASLGFDLDAVAIEALATPEPAALALLASGLAGLGMARRRKRA